MKLDYTKLNSIAQTGQNVVPVVVQDAISKDVLILAYVNEVALEHTQRTGYATFWSTSRNELWEKGKTSGNRLKMVDIWVNCEDNSLLFLVELEGEGACHVKDESGHYFKSCYHRSFL
ncbi:MAG: phosphoribosyl-AMP cyclohydrolase [bacterium]|nr:phosphoribosyl-AMP cyclohydrolase [bacterium]